MDIIERLEALQGPDRHLDYAIHRFVNDLPDDWPACTGNHIWMGGWYTKSVDDALKLVPEDYFWAVMMDGNLEGYQAAVSGVDTISMTFVIGATPAIALCLASLRAGITKGNDDE